MIGYTTQIDIKNCLVRTTFGKEVRTFCYNDGAIAPFPIEDALKVATEDFVNQLKTFLEDLANHAENEELSVPPTPWCHYCGSWHSDQAPHIKVRTIVDSLGGIKVEVFHDRVIRFDMKWSTNEWVEKWSMKFPTSPVGLSVILNGIDTEDANQAKAAIACITGAHNG